VQQLRTFLSAGRDRGLWRELCWTGDSRFIQILNIAEMDIPSFLVRDAEATLFFFFPFDTPLPVGWSIVGSNAVLNACIRGGGESFEEGRVREGRW